jgi:GntR family transcriptional regulator
MALLPAALGTLPKGHAPLYQRLADHIHGTIGRLGLAPGTQLPTEEQMSRHFGLSVITVRGALQDLQRRGIVERQQGRGTFVAKPSSPPSEWGLGSVEDLVMTGRLTEVKVLNADLEAIPEWAAPHLGGAAEGRAFHVRITRSKDGVPFMMTDAFYPAAIGEALARQDLPQLLERNPLLIGAVEQSTGDRVVDMHQTMSATLAGADAARTLGVRRGAPVLQVTRVNLTEDGRLLQVARSHYRTDGATYSIHLKRG